MIRLAVFAKPPRPGLVKTRLIPDIGAAAAAAVYRYCLRHTLDVARRSGFEPVVYLTEASADDLFRQRPTRLQSGDGLGERMHNALAEMLAEGKGGAMIVGSDCLDLEPRHIEQAAQALEQADLVLLPAHDGGYALIGCRRADPVLFDAVDWSTASVLRQTLRNADRLGYRVIQLETVRDIDTLRDMQRYPALRQIASSA